MCIPGEDGSAGDEKKLLAERIVGLTLGNCVLECDWTLTAEQTAVLRKQMIERTIEDLEDESQDRICEQQ